MHTTHSNTQYKNESKLTSNITFLIFAVLVV